MEEFEKQMEYAETMLRKIEAIDPYAIVAGGAPRDWFLGREAADIDIFIHIPEYNTLGAIQRQLRSTGLRTKQMRGGGAIPDHYKNNPDLRYVFDLEGTDYPIQVMVMSKPTFTSVIPKFPLSICKAWYKGGVEIRTEYDFLRSMRKKIIWKTSEIHADENRYIQKILNKFPDYTYCSDPSIQYYLGE